eukprot:TRINITY_DN11838_c0_g1_i1.p1 TRINITY_DN11838_c0_g1~~TRINITY_DN11838_c0_g1_i1.p1  ORF type:complete len:196 (-),score=26.43 TRINITY_DN11838_c0_g1_i1:92-679(-)
MSTSDLERVRREYEETIPTPCNWPKMVFLLCQMRYHRTKITSSPTPTNLNSRQINTHHAKRQKRRVPTQLEPEPKKTKRMNLDDLNRRFDRLRKSAKTQNEQAFLDQLEEKLVTRVFDDCAICQEVPENPNMLECGHIFCRVCTETWQLKAPVAFCPLCKQRCEKEKPILLPRVQIAKKSFLSIFRIRPQKFSLA